MKNKDLMQRILGVLLLSLNVVLGYAAMPKFSITPLSPLPQGQIAGNEVVNVAYVVTNNTKDPRVLTMSPITGINQITAFPGACAYPFFLRHNESCMLILQIVATATYGGVHSNIVVCKTMGPGDNRPDPFLCSQTDPSQGLQFNLGPSQPATIAANPSPPSELLFSIIAGGAVTVTNTSQNFTAQNITGSLPTNPNFTVSSQCPANLLPNQSCQVIYNSAVVGTAQSTIQGTNTNAITVSMEAVKPTIAVTAPPTFIVGNGGLPGSTSGQIIVTNTSLNGASADNVTATITSGPFFVVASTCGGIIPPGSSCTITVNTNTNAPVVNGTAIVKGLNTDPTTINLTAQQTTITASPASASIAVGQEQDITINNVPPVAGNALNVQPQIPQGAPFTFSSTTCSNFASSCTIKFKATAQTTSPVTIPIAGSNTTTTSVSLSAVMPTISVSPTNVSLVNGNSVVLTVTNTSAVAIPGGVKATLLPPLSVSATTCSGPLAASPASCTITILAATGQATTSQSVLIHGTDTNRVGVRINAGPAVLSLNPSTVIASAEPIPPYAIGSTSVSNTSAGGNAVNVAATIPASANISATSCSAISQATPCTMNFNYSSFSLTGLQTAVQVPIQGTNTTTANLYIAPYSISVSPSSITIGASNPGTVTVTASGLSITKGGFQGMMIGIPPGSTITVANNGCATGIAWSGPSTGSCTIEFIGGPLVETQVITLQGLTSAGVTATNPTSFTAVSGGQSTALIGFSGSSSPTTTGTIDVDSSGGGTLTLQIVNSSTTTPSPTTDNITATLPSTWTGVTATYSSECSSLAVGSSPTPTCTINLTSSTPNLAGAVTISADNTNILTANVAFQSGGGLIYDLSNGVSVVDLNDSSASPLAWGGYLDTLATSKTDGASNQVLILAADPTAPAAAFCESYPGSFETDWYLPAIQELATIYSGLATLGFGNFASTFYWSSTQSDIGKAWYYNFTTATNGANVDYKDIAYNIRCVRKA
ncbi:hypothetical protein BN59_00375 [Legionella massiliensis]|uniref:Protein with a bacterial immunoglobulin-like domain protein n=1 Tax=Legionella massiliensis TaxID=1034943 RepID=A0A078KSR8_9GAMM|nr:DUF1566 domain-containing protein [Legionella massiliensis]CDZ76111.1 hypothetical protein BN59_00375 [Legionella massiliensis]CEE11849.1 hypothetical protein BN1094_00375 [Legionella massiliensis]